MQSTQHRLSAFLFAASVAVCLPAAGCRDSRDPNTCWISGSATCDGQPIALGELVFESENAAIAAAACRIRDGAFKMRVPKGGHLVRLYGYREVPLPPEKRPPQPPGLPPPPTTETFQYLPERYNSHTDLKVEVKKSGDTFTFDLDSKPDPKK